MRRCRSTVSCSCAPHSPARPRYGGKRARGWRSGCCPCRNGLLPGHLGGATPPAPRLRGRLRWQSGRQLSPACHAEVSESFNASGRRKVRINARNVILRTPSIASLARVSTGQSEVTRTKCLLAPLAMCHLRPCWLHGDLPLRCPHARPAAGDRERRQRPRTAHGIISPSVIVCRHCSPNPALR